MATDGAQGAIISKDDTFVMKPSGVYRKINRNGTDGSCGLARIVEIQNWPTPTGTERSGVNPNTGRGAGLSKINGGQLNADWVEILMGYNIGYTNIDCDTPTPWPGWPAGLGAREWGTHTASYTVRSDEFIRETVSPAEFVAKGMDSGQYPYEPPRVITGQRNRAKRLKCLGNSVVPQQAYPIFQSIMEVEKEWL